MEPAGCARGFAVPIAVPIAVPLAAPLAVPMDSAASASAFECTHPGCTKAFGRRSNLDAHVRVAHAGERFICPHPGCGKALRHKHRLASHLALHAAHAGREDELRRPYPKLARASADDERPRRALAACRKRAMALGGGGTCPRRGRSCAARGFAPHLVLCTRAHAAVLADAALLPREASCSLDAAQAHVRIADAGASLEADRPMAPDLAAAAPAAAAVTDAAAAATLLAL